MIIKKTLIIMNFKACASNIADLANVVTTEEVEMYLVSLK